MDSVYEVQLIHAATAPAFHGVAYTGFLHSYCGDVIADLVQHWRGWSLYPS